MPRRFAAPAGSDAAGSGSAAAPANRRMRQHKINCLPVVDCGQLAGIVTAFDLLGVLAGALV